MEWTDEAVILGGRRHGEADLVLEVLTRRHGRHFGLVRGGRARRMAAVVQPGNEIEVTWRARLDEHLGAFRIEGRVLRGAVLMDSATALYALATLVANLRLLPERDPHEGVYAAVATILPHLADGTIASALLIRFEAALLTELGFGMDLSCCALTGVHEGLAYVSPKTGRAVAGAAGAPWAQRLLPLPAFLSRTANDLSPDPAALIAGFALTGHFLQRHVWEPRGLPPPPERARLIASLMQGAQE